MSRIFWQVHNAGLINQLMSVEIGCGLAFAEKKPIIFNTFKDFYFGSIYSATKIPQERMSLINSIKPNLFQIIDIPDDIVFLKENEILKLDCHEHKDIITYYYKCKNGENENYFSENRKELILNKDKDNSFKDSCFSFYSRYFYNRQKQLDLFLKNIKFKDQYLFLAKKISYILGNFSVIHFRLTDHEKLISKNTTDIKKIDYIKSLSKKNKNLIILSDDTLRLRNMFKENGINPIFMDDIIINNFKEDFLNLDFHDEIVFSLICLLVACDSEYFLGTAGSTFSSYIHRVRFLNGKRECFLSMESHLKEDFIQNGPYSWNGFDCNTSVKNWWREWPECQLNFND